MEWVSSEVSRLAFLSAMLWERLVGHRTGQSESGILAQDDRNLSETWAVIRCSVVAFSLPILESPTRHNTERDAGKTPPIFSAVPSEAPTSEGPLPLAELFDYTAVGGLVIGNQEEPIHEKWLCFLVVTQRNRVQQ